MLTKKFWCDIVIVKMFRELQCFTSQAGALLVFAQSLIGDNDNEIIGDNDNDIFDGCSNTVLVILSVVVLIITMIMIVLEIVINGSPVQ